MYLKPLTSDRGFALTLYINQLWISVVPFSQDDPRGNLFLSTRAFPGLTLLPRERQIPTLALPQGLRSSSYQGKMTSSGSREIEEAHRLQLEEFLVKDRCADHRSMNADVASLWSMNPFLHNSLLGLPWKRRQKNETCLINYQWNCGCRRHWNLRLQNHQTKAKSKWYSLHSIARHTFLLWTQSLRNSSD